MKKHKQITIRVNEAAYLKCKEVLSQQKKNGINTFPIWYIVETCAVKKLEHTAQDAAQLYRKKSEDLVYIAVNISADLVQAVRLRMIKTDGDVASFFSESFENYYLDVLKRPTFEAIK